MLWIIGLRGFDPIYSWRYFFRTVSKQPLKKIVRCCWLRGNGSIHCFFFGQMLQTVWPSRILKRRGHFDLTSFLPCVLFLQGSSFCSFRNWQSNGTPSIPLFPAVRLSHLSHGELQDASPEKITPRPSLSSQISRLPAQSLMLFFVTRSYFIAFLYSMLASKKNV